MGHFMTQYFTISRKIPYSVMPKGMLGSFCDHCLETASKDLCKLPSKELSLSIGYEDSIMVSQNGSTMHCTSDFGTELASTICISIYARAGIALPVNVKVSQINDLIFKVQKAYRKQGWKGRMLELVWFGRHILRR